MHMGMPMRNSVRKTDACTEARLLDARSRFDAVGAALIAGDYLEAIKRARVAQQALAELDA